MNKIDKKTKLNLVIALVRNFFLITFFIVAPIFFITVASNTIPSWIKAVIIYIVLPILTYSSLRFFYKRKLIKMGLTHDPLNVRFSSMGNGRKLIAKNLDKQKK